MFGRSRSRQCPKVNVQGPARRGTSLGERLQVAKRVSEGDAAPQRFLSGHAAHVESRRVTPSTETLLCAGKARKAALLAQLRGRLCLSLESCQALVTVARCGATEDSRHGPEPSRICFLSVCWQDSAQGLSSQHRQQIWAGEELKKTQKRISHLLANPCIKWQDPDSRFFLHHVSNWQHLPGKAESELQAAEISSAPATPTSAGDPTPEGNRSLSHVLGPERVGSGTGPCGAGAGEAPGREREAGTRLPALAQDTGVLYVLPATQQLSQPYDADNGRHFLTSDRDYETNVTNV